MKILSILIALLFSAQAYSSTMIIESKRFRCSNQQTYDLAILIIGGYGNDSWSLRGLCRSGILENESYNGRGFYNEHLERCYNDESLDIRRCFNEFVRLNGDRGNGTLPYIRHGASSEIRCRVIDRNNVRCNGMKYKKVIVRRRKEIGLF